MIKNEDELRKKVISLLEMIYDPEIPVNIYQLGLIYKIEFSEINALVHCDIEMTLTSAACPVAESLIDQVYNISLILEEIETMKIDVVFEPPWSPENIPYETRLELGLL